MYKVILAILLTASSAFAESFVTETSWYSNVETHNRPCADGRFHDLNTELVAASWDYPLHTYLRITSVTSGKSILAEVCDRGPARRLYRAGRRLDLSARAFKVLDGGKLDRGILQIKVEVI